MNRMQCGLFYRASVPDKTLRLKHHSNSFVEPGQYNNHHSGYCYITDTLHQMGTAPGDRKQSL